MTEEEWQAFFAHFGTKGMKWGVRKSLSTSDDRKDSDDINRQAKIGGVTSLSNKEIQDAITRMSLESQYKKLKGDSSLKQRGLKLVGGLLLSFGKDYIASYIKYPGANAATGGNFAWAYAGAKTINGVVVNQRELGR